MAEKKKEAAPPARPTETESAFERDMDKWLHDSLPTVATVAAMSHEKEKPVEPVDPWAASKASGFDAQRIVQKAQSLGVERSEGGVMLVTPAVLVALGMGEDRARAAIEAARAWSCDLATTEGGRVYALSAPGRVAIQSYARKPRTARVMGYVREPSRLRAGDEVGFVYTSSGMAEVRYGR